MRLSGLIKKALVTLLIAYLGIAAFLYSTQELFIFPMLRARLRPSQNPVIKPPSGIDEFFVRTEDGNDIHVWTTFKPGDKPQNVAMIFHGNGETVSSQNFLPFFKNLGVPAFTFDYRGYGRSSGWPSEEAINSDAAAVWAEIQKRTGIDSKHLILLGNSIGSGPATFLAHKISPKALILIAAYSDFPTLVSGMPLYAPFRFILRYQLPVASYLKDLNVKCLIMAHGKQDEVIPLSHLETNLKNVKTDTNLTVLESEDARHGDIFYKVEDRLNTATKKCLGSDLE